MNAKEGQRAYKEGRFDDAVRLLADSTLGSPGDLELRLMLARACVRSGDADLAWFLFDHVAARAPDDATRALAEQGRASLAAPAASLDARAVRAGVLDPVRLAKARKEAHAGESALSWLVRQDELSFDRLIEMALGGASLPPSRPARERLGMRLLADRRISQGDLKQALSQQARHLRPLGSLLTAEFGLPPDVLQSYLQTQSPLPVTLGPLDHPAALLIRWGALRQEDWETVRALGPKAFEALVAQGRVLPGNVRRAEVYRHAKRRFLLEGKVRLGEILLEQGAIDLETLGKALATQVDQPYRLGELLIRRRWASAERVVEALLEQARRYDAAAEGVLPPLEAPAPPTPPEASIPPKHRRRLWASVGVAGAVLGLAIALGNRYVRNDYSWLALFNVSPEARERQGPGVAELLGGSQTSGPRWERATIFDPLNLPANSMEGQALSESLGEGMVGSQSAEGFVGNPLGEGMLGSAQPRQLHSGFVGEATGFEALGRPTEAERVGSSGVTDSVAYGRQEPSGARRSAISREAELLALEKLPYPMEDQLQLGGSPSPRQATERQGGERAEGRLTHDELQVPIGLNRVIAGSPPESIQVRRDTAVFRLRLGQSLLERNDALSAREEFLSAISLDPTLSPPHYFLGRIAEARGDRELAAKWYRSYLARSAAGEYPDEVSERLRALGR